MFGSPNRVTAQDAAPGAIIPGAGLPDWAMELKMIVRCYFAIIL